MATTETTNNQSVSDKNTPFINSLVTPEELKRFKEIVFSEYGIRLTDEQAFEQATALLGLFDALLKERLAYHKKRANMNSNPTGITSCEE